jgi:hypothetical protein
MYTVRNVSDFPVPSRLGTGKIRNLFFTVYEHRRGNKLEVAHAFYLSSYTARMVSTLSFLIVFLFPVCKVEGCLCKQAGGGGGGVETSIYKLVGSGRACAPVRCAPPIAASQLPQK